MSAFGKFPSLSAFLESYKTANKKKILKSLLTGPPSLSLKKIKAQQKKKPRDVVEVEATLKLQEPDDTDPSGGLLVRLRIVVTQIVVDDPDVSKYLKDAKAKAREIFVAIRSGDSMGVQEPMKGLKVGAALKIKGEGSARKKPKPTAARRCPCCASPITQSGSSARW